MKLTSHALQRLAAAAITGTVILLPAVALASGGPAATARLPASGARPALPAAAYVASNGSDALTPVGTAGTWKLLPAAPVTAVPGSVVSVWTGREMIIHGSLNGQPVTGWTGRQLLIVDGVCCDGSSNGGVSYTPATNTWRDLPNAPLQRRRDARGAWTGKELVVAGGLTGIQ
jgi:hypothetical protein